MQRSGLRRCILGPLCLPSAVAGEKKEEREKRQIQLASCYLHWIFFGKNTIGEIGYFTKALTGMACFL
ncbi:CATSPERE isoform 1 [Pan troglodytes]|uniref:CATSPERE isoform 1 n=1 Tax=Pan troglodytes TaxID=9598 RepID=A0A2J8KNI8_PANTR|nr:CATSPERE isoform 1 [Pan troglodytes]